MKLVSLVLLSFLPLVAADPDWPSLENHAIEFLQQYIRIATVNPPADTRQAAALFQSELEKNGLKPDVFQSAATGQTNLMVRLPGRDRSRKPLLLLNHFDVVPVDAKAWSVDPFAATIKDGQIWGRGSLDMKGIAVQQLTALIAMHKSGIVPPRDIVMISTADEESSGVNGIQWMIAHHYPEFDPEYVLDEGGLGSRDLFAKDKLVFGVAVGEKQINWLRLRAKGTAGHGSQPIPDNANMILLDAIRKALALPEQSKPNPVIDQLKKAVGGELAPNKYTAAIQRNTISLTTLTAGVGSPAKVNVIPSTSEATLDCRLLPGVNGEEFISEMKARINDPRVSVEIISRTTDTGASRSDTPLFAAIKNSITAHHPGAIVTPIFVPFGTDSAYLRMRGVVAYGLTPMILDTATAATMHSDQERIPLEEFRKGLRIYFDVLKSEY